MTEKQLAAIRRHGEQLLVLFPNATEQDPVRLCKQLRRLEEEGARIGLRLCNGPTYETEDGADRACALVLHKVYGLLTGSFLAGHDSREVPIILNRDPRGYALKIEAHWMTSHKADLHKDWGGYGIIAPEIGADGHA